MPKTKKLKIAIHSRPGSFSDRWIKYCQEKQIDYALVNCYDTEIINQLRSFDILLWHWHHEDTKAILFARQFLASVEKMGIKVYPNINTCWHYDDKLGQKYLLESIDVPFVKTYVFYDKKQAMSWINSTSYPKVFKLRGGAGSMNVRLVRNISQAKKLCKQSFGKGFKPVASYFSDMSRKMKKNRGLKDYFARIQKMPLSLKRNFLANKERCREKGYAYYQDFVPHKKYDTRITVIGNRAFAFRRMVRKNDFRASGSGKIDYDLTKINMKCIKIAFDVARKIKSQSIVFDFLDGEDSSPLIIEVSYAFIASAVRACKGYWDIELYWHEGQVWPQDAILEDLIGE